MRFNVKTGDTAPLKAQLKYTDGSGPINLSGAVVTIYIGDSLVSGGACTIDDAANGWVSYPWQPGENDNPGSWSVEFKVLVAGKFKRVPSGPAGTIRISRRVGAL